MPETTEDMERMFKQYRTRKRRKAKQFLKDIRTSKKDMRDVNARFTIELVAKMLNELHIRLGVIEEDIKTLMLALSRLYETTKKK